MRIVTYNVEWFTELFDNEGNLLEDDEISGRDRITRADQIAALVAQVLGNVAGDLALVNLPFGGVYLIGGVSRALAPYLMQFGFAEAFSNKGRFGPFMAQFGVSVVEDDFAALTGCAQALIEL